MLLPVCITLPTRLLGQTDLPPPKRRETVLLTEQDPLGFNGTLGGYAQRTRNNCDSLSENVVLFRGEISSNTDFMRI